MMNSVIQTVGSTVAATDGHIGHVEEAYFDDRAWAIRWLVVDTGTWIAERKVLISPYSVVQPLGSGKVIEVSLSRAQIENSPDVDTHQPVSRRREREYLRYFAYPDYWGGDGLWAMADAPLFSPSLAGRLETDSEHAHWDDDVLAEDVHLRSSAKVTGYDIEASDDAIGHVKDFIFDDETWAIRYLLVDTRNWWPGGKKVLVATHWIDRIDWDQKRVFASLTREQIMNSPEYEAAAGVDREYEKRLHAAYNREGYWD